jgi:beta-galactosidase
MRGKTIDVRCFSNCDEVELFLNGQSLDRKSMSRNSHLAWQVAYEPGKLEAHGYRAGKRVLRTQLETSGPPARVVLQPDRSTIRADGQDVTAITVAVIDAVDRPVPTASDLIHFKISGPGKILGVGNGDPSSHESDKAPQRRLFNGLALALVQSGEKPGRIVFEATGTRLQSAELAIHCIA